MRVLVISQYFWPENFRINDLVEGLLAKGHEITVLTGLPNYPSGKLAPGYTLRGPYSGTFGRAQVVRVPLIPRGSGGGIKLFLNYVSFAIAASAMLWRCEGPYDAIFVFEPSPITVGIPARLASKVKGAPILFWVQDLWPDSLAATGAITSPRALKVVESLVRWIYKGCARILVQSEAFMQPIAALGVAREKIRYFPNSAEAVYQPAKNPTVWTGPVIPPGFRLMFAGNIGAAQSIETILAAAEILRSHGEIRWIILGDGRLAPWLKQEIVQRGLQTQIYLMGAFPMATMPDWFTQADVMLTTLRRDPALSLTIPSKIQSYLACAKPIVAALDGEGARLIQLAGAGFTAPAQDAAGLAEAVLKIYELSPASRKELGNNGRRYYEENFDRDALLDKLEVWLSEVV